MSSTALERIDTAVRNILAGDNACGTLANAVQRRDADYFRRAVEPVVRAYEEEAADLRKQRALLLKDVENKRFALEMVVSNFPHLPPQIADAVNAALGRG